MIIQGIICICNAWFLDIVISTCSSSNSFSLPIMLLAIQHDIMMYIAMCIHAHSYIAHDQCNCIIHSRNHHKYRLIRKLYLNINTDPSTLAVKEHLQCKRDPSTL